MLDEFTLENILIFHGNTFKVQICHHKQFYYEISTCEVAHMYIRNLHIRKICFKYTEGGDTRFWNMEHGAKN